MRNQLVLDSAVERELALKLLQCAGTVQRAAELYKPNILADYLFTLSQLYSRFYQSSPVLRSDELVRDSRVKLCAMVARVLSDGLHLLGIRTPNRI